jgi:hypothetical protein
MELSCVADAIILRVDDAALFRSTVIEYQLTNIRRAEPPPDLFEVPQDYATDPTTADNPWLKLEFAEPPRGAKSPSSIRQ